MFKKSNIRNDKFKNAIKYIGETDFNISSPVGDFNYTAKQPIIQHKTEVSQ